MSVGGAGTENAPQNPPLKTRAPLDRTPYVRDPRSAPASGTTSDGGYVDVRDARGTVYLVPDGPHMHPKVLGEAQPASYAGDMTIESCVQRTSKPLSHVGWVEPEARPTASRAPGSLGLIEFDPPYMLARGSLSRRIDRDPALP